MFVKEGRIKIKRQLCVRVCGKGKGKGGTLSPETLGWGGAVVVGDVVEGVDLAEGAKGAFQVVDDGARHEGLGAVGGEAWAEVDVMVDGRLVLVVRVGEVRFLALPDQ